MSGSAAPWPIAVSTLGAPGESLETVIGAAVRSGVGAVELTAAPDALVNVGLSSSQPGQLRRRLEAAGLGVLAVASGLRLGAQGTAGAEFETALAGHVVLASDLGARFLRVFPGLPVDTETFRAAPTAIGDRQALEAVAADRLARAVSVASEAGLRIAVETHDSNPRGEDLGRILEQLGAEAQSRVGVVWDVLHPWRTGESPPRTWELLSRFLLDGRGYVQIKDVASPDVLTPVLQGEGQVPLQEILTILDQGGYCDWVSLEWEKTWYPDVEPLEAALEAAVEAVRLPRSDGTAVSRGRVGLRDERW